MEPLVIISFSLG